MVRSLWQGALVLMLATAGLAWAQQQPRSSRGKQITMTVYENGKELRCRMLAGWRTPSGSRAFQLQVLSTGEMLTLLENPATAVPGNSGAMAMKIFHWGQSRTSPLGAPVPPPTRPAVANAAQASTGKTVPRPTPAAGTSQAGLPPVPTILTGPAPKSDGPPAVTPTPISAPVAAKDIEIPAIPLPPDVEAAKKKVAPVEHPPILINVGNEHPAAAKAAQTLRMEKSTPAGEASPASGRRSLTVYENGKELHCTIITSWKTPRGARAFHLQVVGDGEILTLVEDGPATSFHGQSGKMRALSMKVYHWGQSNISPAGAPVPPGGSEHLTAEESEPRSPASTRPDVVSGSQPELVPVASPSSAAADCGCSSCVNNGSSEPRVPGRRLFRRLFGRADAATCQNCPPSAPCVSAPCVSAPCVSAPCAGKTSGSATPATEPLKIHEQVLEGAPQVSGTNIPGQEQIMPGQPMEPVAPPPALPTVTSPYRPEAPIAASQASAGPTLPPSIPTVSPSQPVPAATPSVTPSAPTIMPSQAAWPPPVASQGPAANIQQNATPAAPAAPAAPPAADWRNEWGQPAYANKTRQPGQTLVDPTPVGKGPALPPQYDGPPAPAVAKNTSPATGGSATPNSTTSNVVGTIAHALPPAPPASVTEASKQPDPLLNPERYQPAAVQKKIGTSGQVYVPRPGANMAAPPGASPPLPLGTVSVLAAQNGMIKPVQFVPVPVPTVPQPWRAPAPPPPTLPQAPQLAGYVNAFTQPRPETPPPEPQPPMGAFTSAPNSGPLAYGQMPYGPMGYGQMGYGQMPYGYRPMGYGYDPRMMAAYNPQQRMYGPYVNPPYMPPSLTSSLPAYAYQQMAQGLPPQRPVVQMNFPASYQGPMPPNLVPNQQPYVPFTPAMQPYPNPAMDRPGMPAQPTNAAPGNVIQTGFNPSKTVLTLRDSIYPAEREVAAINLAQQDLRTQPQALQVLISTARQDPAGSVRAACVRCLARQALGNDQVVNLFNDLRNDQDPRVRQEVDHALAQIRR